MTITALWCLTAILLVLALNGSSQLGRLRQTAVDQAAAARRAALHAEEEGAEAVTAPPVRPLDTMELLVRWMWIASVAVLVITGWASVSRLVVSDDELLDAAQRATALVDRTTPEISTRRLEIAISDDLGRDVRLTSVKYDNPDDASTYDYYYLVTVGEQVEPDDQEKAADGADVVCVRISEPRGSIELPDQPASASAFLSSCPDD